MRKFNTLAKLLFPAFLIFPYVAQAEMPINQSELVSASGSWRYKPNFSDVRTPPNCKPHKNIKFSTQFYVDKNGDILQPRILKSSGHQATDMDVIRQLRTGKFYPFLKNGMPVIGKATLPLSITCPPPPPPPSQDEQRQEILKQLGISNRKENF